MSADIFGDVTQTSLRWPGDRADRVGMLHALPESQPAPVSVGLTRDDVMTACEVAELLHLPVSTVYYLARQGRLPASRLGRTWRFLRPRIEEMLRA